MRTFGLKTRRRVWVVPLVVIQTKTVAGACTDRRNVATEVTAVLRIKVELIGLLVRTKYHANASPTWSPNAKVHPASTAFSSDWITSGSFELIRG